VGTRALLRSNGRFRLRSSAPADINTWRLTHPPERIVFPGLRCAQGNATSKAVLTEHRRMKVRHRDRPNAGALSRVPFRRGFARRWAAAWPQFRTESDGRQTSSGRSFSPRELPATAVTSRTAPLRRLVGVARELGARNAYQHASQLMPRKKKMRAANCSSAGVDNVGGQGPDET
jgi:hypothetical protein